MEYSRLILGDEYWFFLVDVIRKLEEFAELNGYESAEIIRPSSVEILMNQIFIDFSQKRTVDESVHNCMELLDREGRNYFIHGFWYSMGMGAFLAFSILLLKSGFLNYI